MEETSLPIFSPLRVLPKSVGLPHITLADPGEVHRNAIQALNERQAKQAIPLLSTLLDHFPDNGVYWDHFLAAHAMAGNYEEAESAYQRCEVLNAVFSETLINAAHNAREWGRADRLIEYANKILNKFPEERIRGLEFLTDGLWLSGQHEASFASCQKLLQEKPDHPAALRLYIKNLIQLKRPAEALETCNRILAETPDLTQIIVLRIEALIAYGELQKALEVAGDWIRRLPEEREVQITSCYCFYSQFLPELSASDRRQRAEVFSGVLSTLCPTTTCWNCDKDPDRPLRIGFLSGDLRQHPVGYFIRPWLAEWKESPLSLHVFDTLNQSDELTTAFRSYVDSWHRVDKLSNHQLYALIQAQEIDILFDLHGHTTGQRLGVMAMKPSPVQVSFHGFLGTTGLKAIDYQLADSYCVPEGAEDEFVEKIWRIPFYYCYQGPGFELPNHPPPSLENGYITFGSLNKVDKLNDCVLSLWWRLLLKVPNSRLLIKGKGLDTPDYKHYFERRLLNAGFDINRVIIEKPETHQKFLSCYHNIDIALDPFPYSGATTTVEALWAGVPVLSLKGNRMVWRMSESLLTQVGMSDWLADNEAHFVELGAQKASDLKALAVVRQSQRARILNSSLVDARLYASHLEKALRKMWKIYCSTAYPGS